LDDGRGLVAFHDDRTSPWICQALERHGDDVTNLLLQAGWFDCLETTALNLRARIEN
jgi:hypothetical protein